MIVVEPGRTHAKERDYPVTIEDSGIDPGFQIFRRAGLYLGTSIVAVVAGAASIVTAATQDVEWLWAPAGVLFALGLVDPGGGARDAHIRIVGKDARQTYTCPVGITTTASVSEAEVELARRRAAAAY